MGENRRFEVERPINYQFQEETSYMNASNIVGRESDIQTERFNYPVNNIVGDVLVLDRPIILTNVIVGINAGGYSCAINGDIICNGSVLSPANFDFKFPNWKLYPDEELTTSINNGGVVWIGYYAD